MKWLYGIGLLCLALFLGWLWLFQPSWHRYRLTLVVETPEGVRQASGVLQSIFYYTYGANGTLTGCELRGEAVFLEIPGGRNLVMLLAHGIRGDNVDLMCQLPARVLLGPTPTYGPGPYDRFYESWPLRQLSGAAVLPLEMIPTLVTFTDLANPASAQVIRPQGLGAFGPGYGLKEVRLEMVSSGLWPFNLLPIPFPQPLSGTPITTGIEGKMPGLKNIDEWNRKARPRLSPADSYGGGSGSLIRNW